MEPETCYCCTFTFILIPVVTITTINAMVAITSIITITICEHVFGQVSAIGSGQFRPQTLSPEQRT